MKKNTTMVEFYEWLFNRISKEEEKLTKGVMELHHVAVINKIRAFEEAKNFIDNHRTEKITDEYLIESGFSVSGVAMFSNEKTGLKGRRVSTKTGKYFYEDVDTKRKLFDIVDLL